MTLSTGPLELELRELLGATLTVETVRRLEGGYSRETWGVRVTGGPPGVPRDLVVRRDAASGIVQTPLAVEYRLYEALAKLDLPLPTVLAVSPDGGRLGRPYYVMTRCEGTGDARAVRALDTDARVRLASQAMRALAQLHSVDATDLDVLQDGRSTSAAAEVRHWAGVLDSVRLASTPALALALTWLSENAAVAEGAALLHGDFRTGNLLHRADGSLTAILDWELAHRGTAAEDLGWFCMRRWRWAGTTLVGGLVPRDDLLDLYRSHGGEVDARDVRFWEVLGNVKLAAFQATSRFRLSKGEAVRLPTIRSSLYLEHQSLFTVEALIEAVAAIP
ncbi:phosphotransferase family protein [Actinophytocola sp.]|uniref:phosphotransferase family protein n=1 Tax=Actinophytocola sp. TaxID=1872138 RepID=UPI003D6B4C1C